MTIKEKQARRFNFLQRVYEIVDGVQHRPVDGREVGRELDYDSEETNNIFYYLLEKGLIKGYGAGLSLTITLFGIEEVESAATNPESPTIYFPEHVINNINIGTMTNSTIQQGSHGSNQAVNFNKELVPDLQQILEELNQSLDKLVLSVDVQGELIAEMNTLKAQSTSPKPKINIVKESLASVRSILEGVATEALSPMLIANISLLLSQLN